MYSIANVFYGVNLRTDEFERFTDDLGYIHEAELATSQYSGAGESPLYLGYDLSSFDECSDMRMSEMITTVPDDKAQEAKQKLADDIKAIIDDDEVSQEFKDALITAKPDVWLVWSTS